MPDTFIQLARDAAEQAGFLNYIPDSCLINRYTPGSGMGLHQDKDEQDMSAPIVSVSLGVPVIFLFGTRSRKDRPGAWLLQHGDVVVWGGTDRLRFHGIKPLKLGHHPLTGQLRFNLTLRKAY
jgi:alkylated DNA repair protein (DNA oxidative demethylase)